jgi:hypothetical protein
VGDVGPPDPVVVGHLDGVAEQLLLRVRPELADPRQRELALLAPGGVGEMLEAVHRDLPEDGRDRALDALRQQAEPRRGRRRVLQQTAEDQRLAEHARRLGQRQRRREVEHALVARERRVQPMAELVREREHVAPARRVVEHHIRRRARHRVGAERAAPLAGPDRRVDPAVVEERPRGVGELGREAGERLEHHVLRARPGDLLVLVGDGRHAVVVGEPVEPEQPRLEPVPPAGQLVAAAYRDDQRLDGLVGRLVGEVAAREPVRVGPQPVVDHLLRQQRVEHVAAHAQPRLERARHGARSGLALLALG